MSRHEETITVNGRAYNWPEAPVVVICCDGSEPDYMEIALAQGKMPNLKRMLSGGEDLRADCVVPSFTNPNNLSIVTGRPPSVHGICGNYYYDTENDREVMMNDPALLRAPTIFAGFQAQGARVAVVTAKDKLRRLLGHGLNFADETAVCFSAELADQCTIEENGIKDVLKLIGKPVPEVYSQDLSEFVFAAGVKLMARMRPELCYLSTSDYVQHKFAPGTDGANRFYLMMDNYLGQLHDAGAVVLITADHGMNAKHDGDGEPRVIYLQDLLDEWLGTGQARVILPITDPYVVHHGALGSFATAYLPAGFDIATLLDRLNRFDGMEIALDRDDGCARFELPPDRMGDIIVVSERHRVLGTTAARHDLAALTEPLRSHGGLAEQRVPFILNRELALPVGNLRNFDAFEVALNRVAD